jgi:hypothetical protein
VPTSSGRLAAIFAVSLTAATVMMLDAALAFGRDPLLDAANLFPPALAFCLAAWLIRDRPTLLTLLLIAVAGLGGVCVSIYLLGDSLSSAVAWGLQWLAALGALATAVIVRLAGGPSPDLGADAARPRRTKRLGATLVGFASGVALGLVVSLLVLRFDCRGFEMGGTTTVYAFGAELFSISGIFANLVQAAVSVVVCVTLGIAGALTSARLRPG